MLPLIIPLVSLASYSTVANAIPMFNHSIRATSPRAYTVASVTELGPITQNSYVKGTLCYYASLHTHYLSNTHAARDNGQSALVNGKSYWFFDDTILTDALYDPRI
jgi:hypothetical protein